MSPSLKNKVIALTGAGNGIALSCAHLLASHSAILCLADIDSSALSRAAESIQSTYTSQNPPSTTSSSSEPLIIRTTTLDVSNGTAVTAWIDGIVAEFGRVGGGVNFAAIQDIGGMAMVEEMGDEHFDKIVAVNFRGTFNAMRAQLRHMKRLGSGSIVNATSIQARYALPTNAAYVATKHAVIGLTKTAAKEAGEKGVRVNVVAPGCIDTRMTDEMEARIGVLDHSSLIALQRKGTAEEVAKMIVFLLSDESAYVTGAVMDVDGGFGI